MHKRYTHFIQRRLDTTDIPVTNGEFGQRAFATRLTETELKRKGVTFVVDIPFWVSRQIN